MPPPHVVLVDPSDSREVLSERLRMQGYQVTATADAATAAHLALSAPPALVIADLWMPGISGVQLCRLLRSEPATEAVPVILRGPDRRLRDRFWAERAGAAAFVAQGRMGDLVRAMATAISASAARNPPTDAPFFTQLSGGEIGLRDRIAAHLDAALFESVIASEVRALSTCGNFPRLFDLLSQFVSQVTSYRWLAVQTARPNRIGLHTHPALREAAEAEVRRVLQLEEEVPLLTVEDEDACDNPAGPAPRVEIISLGNEELGRIILAPRSAPEVQDIQLLRVLARELGGPIRIATLMEESQQLALSDSLTGLLNRRAFGAALGRDLARHHRYRTPLALLLLDIDNFKAINDQHGHSTGDDVLTRFSALLQAQIRGGDAAGRWGGEEFVIALSGAHTESVTGVAERIRAAIEALVVNDSEGVRVPITASIGVAITEAADTAESLVHAADCAMYLAKAEGRNCVRVAPPRVPAPAAPGDPPPNLRVVVGESGSGARSAR